MMYWQLSCQLNNKLLCQFCLSLWQNCRFFADKRTDLVAWSALVQSSDEVREATHRTGVDACSSHSNLSIYSSVRRYTWSAVRRTEQYDAYVMYAQAGHPSKLDGCRCLRTHIVCW